MIRWAVIGIGGALWGGGWWLVSVVYEVLRRYV
jgi:hypothetical protein